MINTSDSKENKCVASNLNIWIFNKKEILDFTYTFFKLKDKKKSFTYF